jgi:hypothetical protein
MLYAVGEIVLVVIGILLALQINEWNENRKIKLAEKVVLNNLKQEFRSNRAELDSILNGLERTRNANLTLMSFFGPSYERIAGANTDSLIFESVEYERFVPTQNALTTLLQSDGLQLLSNDELKNLLYDWSRKLGTIDEWYSGVKEKSEDGIVPYLTPRYPLKDIDKYGALGWETSSVLPADKTAIFQELTYESLIDDFLYRLQRYITSLQEARVIIDEILTTIEEDLKQE